MTELDVAWAKEEIKKRRDKIDALEKKRRGIKNFRYVVSMTLPAVADPISVNNPPNFPLQEVAVNVAAGTKFYAKSMGAVYSVVGTDVLTNASVTTVVPPPRREMMFTFQYRVRDTGSDRFWDNDWTPGAALLGANVNDLRIGRGHAVCSGGAQIVVQMRAQLVAGAAAVQRALGLNPVTQHLLEFYFVGVEVKV